jgi:hypothetical protein
MATAPLGPLAGRSERFFDWRVSQWRRRENLLSIELPVVEAAAQQASAIPLRLTRAVNADDETREVGAAFLLEGQCRRRPARGR